MTPPAREDGISITDATVGAPAVPEPAPPVPAPVPPPRSDALRAASSALRDAAATADAQADASDAAQPIEGEAPPRPRRATTHGMLVTLVAIVVLYTCYLADDLIVPVLLSVFLALCGNPVVAGLRKLFIPRWIGALGLVLGGLATLTVAGTALLPPAAEWMRQVPNELRQHVPKLRELTKPFEDASKATESLEKMTQMGPPAPAAVQVEAPPRRNLMTLLSDAPRALASVLAVLILTFFFMAYGEDLLRRFVSLVPGWHKKRVTVDILRQIQSDISRYMLTITVINMVLGLATGAALYWIGLDLQDAMLWGVVIGILNYAPYLGPLVGMIALTIVGMVEFDSLGHAMLPPAAMLALHVVESQFVTPLTLGARMAISPVILMLWLFLWGWMWGIAGLLLAVPMLVAFKIYCSRVDGMQTWAAMMEPYVDKATEAKAAEARGVEAAARSDEVAARQA
jgi:predicted PurR-regulated permease PerM